MDLDAGFNWSLDSIPTNTILGAKTALNYWPIAERMDKSHVNDIKYSPQILQNNFNYGVE